MNMNSGYSGWSMSRRAVSAYNSGEEPATKAAKTWGWKSAKKLREKISPSSWHHTSKFCNATDFFDLDATYSDFELSDFADVFSCLTKRGKELTREYICRRIQDNLSDGNFDEITARSKAGYFKTRNRKISRKF